MKNVVFLSGGEFINFLNHQAKGTFAHLKMVTPVRMNKTGNPYFGRAFKRTETNILLGGRDYAEGVMTNMGRENIAGTFTAQANKQGEHISRIVLYNEKLNRHYMQVEYFTEVKPKVTYLLDNNEVDKTIFADYLVKKSNATTQPQQRQVYVFGVDITNVESLTLNGTEYRISHFEMHI
jgi:hypothetical protein